MSLYLSKDELEGWSGYKQPTRQIRWLRSYGIRFTVARDGYPRVLRKEVELQEFQKPREPNLDALKNMDKVA